MIKEKYQFKKLLSQSHIAHGISTKVFGSMKKSDDLKIDRLALSKFALSLGSSDDVVCMKQLHSGNVAIVKDTRKLFIKEVSEVQSYSTPGVDAIITNRKNVPLAVLTADCLPIMLYDPEKQVIGISHAGYRGLLQSIIEYTIEKFVSRFDSKPEYIVVGIGPSIETMCYEVGKEIIDKFENVFPTLKNMYSKKDGKFYLNLRETALQCLMQQGILEENIEIIDICTKCDEQLYSYRGGDENKRFASVICLV